MDCTNCLKAVNQHGISVRQAFKRFGMPSQTLRNHPKTGSDKKSLGRKLLLCTDVDQELVNRVFRAIFAVLQFCGQRVTTDDKNDSSLRFRTHGEIHSQAIRLARNGFVSL